MVVLSEVVARCAATWTLKTRVSEGEEKFGFAPIGFVAEASDGHTIEPHVEWFPWATTRSKLAAAVKYLNARRRDGCLLVWVREPDVPFFKHAARYGVLKGGWRVPDKFGEDADGWLFVGRKDKG